MLAFKFEYLQIHENCKTPSSEKDHVIQSKAKGTRGQEIYFFYCLLSSINDLRLRLKKK